MRETMRDMMADAAQGAIKPHLIANNTIEYHRADGTRVVRLHHTDIIEFRPNGKIKIDTQGWKTITTKDRLNCQLPWPDYRITQEKGQWYVYRDGWNGDKIAFYDGIVLPDAFKKPAASVKAEKREIALRASIKKFVNKLDKLDAIPEPSQGDCWGCAMKDQNGNRGLGSDCVAEHVKEGYLHGSLIIRAMESRNYGDLAVVWDMARRNWKGWRNRVKADLRRFLQAELGLAR